MEVGEKWYMIVCDWVVGCHQCDVVKCLLVRLNEVCYERERLTHER